MVLTMSTFQASKEVLLNVLDVFVKDPLLDWLKAAGMATAHAPTPSHPHLTLR